MIERDDFVSQVEKFSQEKADLEAAILARDHAAQKMEERVAAANFN